ncbi:MAG TPA: UvrD-helicase domain-containing protein [Methanocorpusculum sp.]|nr:UvrD-helicase domain-containing protein [Methanocorpusculum sp.]
MPNLTPRQKEALAIGKSLCVTAGAGTGKTFLLSKRYLTLLRHLQEKNGTTTVSEILAISFTEKAANEMRERIESDIHTLAMSASKKEDFQFWANILDEFFRASITTFHGFCASILREFSLEAGLDPSFDILDEIEKQVLITTLIQNILTQPPDDLCQDCELLFEYVNTPEKIIAELLPKYPEFKHHFPESNDEMDLCIQKWKQHILAAIRKRQETFFSEETLNAIENLIELAQQYEDYNDSGAEYLHQIHPIIQQLKKNADAETFCIAITTIKKINGNKTGTRLGSRKVFSGDLEKLRKAFVSLKSAIETIPRGWDMIPNPNDDFSRKSVKIITALGRVTNRIHNNYQQKKQQRGTLDFEDLIRRTKKIIKDCPDILQTLQQRFSYILIDEVQDTDPEQSAIIWNIIGTLTPSNDALFIVGDPKQSIYAFRSADICEVNAMQKRITEKCGTEPIALDVNFRSTKEILRVVNSIFSRLFTETSEAWDVTYEPLIVAKDRKTAKGTVQILRTIPDHSTPNTLLEARTIASRIQELISSNTMICDRNGTHPAQFGDIAVLLETRNNQVMIEYALQEANIPYNIYKSQEFYHSQEIIDITQLLSVVSGIGDDIALYGILRSPYFSIPDTELCITGKGSYYDRVIRYALEKPESQIAAAMTQLKKWKNSAETEQVPELLRRILRESGVYAVYGGMKNGRYILANLEKLIELARTQMRKHAIQLTEFVQILTTGTEQEIKENVAQINHLEREAVQIMTVHAAKGLEFPIVILANLDSTSTSPGTGLVLDKDLGVGLSLRMQGTRDQNKDTFVKRFTQEIRMAKEIAERKRLFYVAMTRARDHLILSYVQDHQTPSKNSRLAWLETYLLPQKSAQPPSFTFSTDDGNSVEISITEYSSDGKIEMGQLPHYKLTHLSP